ncbi:hypothetical protein N7497_011137 [Penicillium chrysogenum]|uniref:Zn(2)-C6 fungal-type domain-containing protein n=1 Tax=Penicillium chrysogenum TaxID=5076 RepID=A0ABQ8W7Y5_PENCH|nr:hypothetical protein N7505_009426 [Penicillium chrysogenum]KAJ6142038.1 hypothetical protein N7497_011137 [Penicillium chrysogenum]
MSPGPVFKEHPKPLSVCDSCFSRKVRCDRGNPCGNCQDNNTTCSRLRVSKRARNTTQLAVIENRGQICPKSLQAPDPQDPQNSLLGLQDYSAAISNSYSRLDYHQSRGASPGYDKPLSLRDAHTTIQYHLDHLEWLTINRRQILESGLGLASQLSESVEDPANVDSDITVEEQIRTPSFELLAWMLKDIKESSLGPFVRDYFRHISEATLKQLGLTLLHRNGSPHDLLISTVCVNAVASRFLTAVTSTGIDSELIHEMTHSVVKFQASAKVALRSISLLSTPSLGLLQALLSGIFLYQGSGDITACWELTKAACRVCTSLGLDTTMKTGGTVCEEEYYCVAWCYILDKNFAFRMGRFETLLDIEIGHFTSGQPSHQHSTSDLFRIYMSLAGVQAAVLPYLTWHSSMLTGGLSSSHGMGKHWLVNMQQIQERIEQISGPYPAWKGLDAQSEISALQFAYHSVMTAIFHVTGGAVDQSVDIRKQRLLEAHHGISSLVSICISAERQGTVALLHWTLLVYPITAYFVLFCNVVATSDTDDFKLMTTIADCLTRIETTSRPIIQVRAIFCHFLSLAAKVFEDESNPMTVTRDHQVQPVQSHSNTLHWMPDSLFLPSTADAIPPFAPSVLAGMEDSSGMLSIFPENEMFTPFSDHFPEFENDPSI